MNDVRGASLADYIILFGFYYLHKSGAFMKNAYGYHIVS